MDAPVHGDEPVDVRLVFDAGVVQRGVEHDDGVRENVGRIRVVQDSPGITLQEVGSEDLHDAVNLLSLSGQVETPQECSVGVQYLGDYI